MARCIGRDTAAPYGLRNSSYTSGRSCSAADGSPCSISDKMRVTSVMMSTSGRPCHQTSEMVTRPQKRREVVEDNGGENSRREVQYVVEENWVVFRR